VWQGWLLDLLLCNFSVLDEDMMKYISYVNRLSASQQPMIWKWRCVINVSFRNVAIGMIKYDSWSMMYERRIESKLYESKLVSFHDTANVWKGAGFQWFVQKQNKDGYVIALVSEMFEGRCKRQILLCENMFTKQTFADEMEWMTNMKIYCNEGLWMICINQMHTLFVWWHFILLNSYM